MRSQEERQNIKFFDSDEIVERYAKNKVHIKKAEERLSERWFSEGDRILELGCGEGRVTRYLESEGYDVVAIDIAEKMVQAADQTLSETEVLIMDASDLGFRDDSFDSIFFTFNGIDHIHPKSKRKTTLKEIHRILRPGGTFIFSTHNRFWVPINPKKILGYFRSQVLTGAIFSDYRSSSVEQDGTQFEFSAFYANPFDQADRLRQLGFEVVDVQDDSNTSFRKYIAPWLYFVCRTGEE
jgi:SAM-dependent methyltransferase